MSVPESSSSRTLFTTTWPEGPVAPWVPVQWKRRLKWVPPCSEQKYASHTVNALASANWNGASVCMEQPMDCGFL